ncbi:MAG: alcohol dehydrogenase catalytic domain-containing protein [Anaerolineae bacterium]|jgi:threonine dehydrogenase-like Zn-dependent dehydrogenase
MNANTTQKPTAHRGAENPLPGRYLLWPLYGAGMENLGVDDRPIEVDMPVCGPDQLLVRHDAVGLCFSDTKIITAGENHPRIQGRNMRIDPVVMGHEVAMTVMQVGENLGDRYKPGERFIIQADIYYKGVGMAYGYMLQGGLSQYNLIGPEVLEGDEGSYLLSVKDTMGHAQAALTEPWACVVASYEVVYRSAWKPGGAVLVVAGPGATGEYDLGAPYTSGRGPAQVVTLGVGGTLPARLRECAAADGFALTELGAYDEGTLAQAVEAVGGGSFDDVVMLGADPALYEALEPLAARGAVLNMVGADALKGTVQVDVGRLHYDGLSLIGTVDRTIATAYRPVRTELEPGGKAAFLGAAGPMGQMHVQRALQAAQGPSLLVATSRTDVRLKVLGEKFARLIEDKRETTRFEMQVPARGQSFSEFYAGLMELTGGTGYDDIVVLAPSAEVLAEAANMLAPGGVMNIFAGLPRGTKAPIDLKGIVVHGVRFTGTSGSSIRDLRSVLDEAEAGRLDPNLSVVAVSGLNDAKKGLEGVMHQAFPGKVVVYPQIVDFPLTALPDLADVLPSVYAKLGPNHSWTVEAEAAFLEELL